MPTAVLPPPPKTRNANAPIAKPDYGVMDLECKVGSFKMMEYNDDKQPEGHFEMSFTGTVLVDTAGTSPNGRHLQTTVHTSGAVSQEVDFHGRLVYHGTGKIIVEGGWHALQWFGQDMTAHLNGCAIFRLAGEFDKDLNTGTYWYADGKKHDWGTQGNQPTVPQVHYIIENPTVRINGKG